MLFAFGQAKLTRLLICFNYPLCPFLAIYDGWDAVPLNDYLTHSSAPQGRVIMAGLDRTRPKENERHIGRVDRAMRPIGRNIGDLAGRKFGTTGGAVFLFEQDETTA